MNLTLGGDLRATQDAGRAVRLVGAVNTVRGTYDFQGRRFDILRDGTVRFDGDRTSSIRRSTSAPQRVIQGVDGARQRARHAARSPTSCFSSTPPLEQADILSLIVFNQPINSARRGAADFAGAARAGDGDRRRRRRSWPSRSATR